MPVLRRKLNPAGRDRKAPYRSGRRSDKQPNPPGNEQENPQGGGRSSVAVNIAFLMPMGSGWSLTVITQLDIEAGASQNSSGRQSTGRIANSYNTTAQDTTSNCGNTTTTNSNNTTTDSSRAYKESNHNEFLLHTKGRTHWFANFLFCAATGQHLGSYPTSLFRKYDDLLHATT